MIFTTKPRLFILTACLLFSDQPLAAAAEKPNIVFLLADDLGGADLRCQASVMKLVLALLAVCLFVPLSVLSAAPPNIVLILADDLGYGDIGCYNDQAKVATPNLDRLAREGMRFTDAHSPCMVCTPTRYSLMTGQMVFRVPNGRTVFTGVGGPSLIAPGRLTLPAMLRDNG